MVLIEKLAGLLLAGLRPAATATPESPEPGHQLTLLSYVGLMLATPSVPDVGDPRQQRFQR